MRRMAKMVEPPPPGGAEIRKRYADGAQLAREIERCRVSGRLCDFIPATIQPVAQRPQTQGNRPLPTNAYVRGHGSLQPPAFHRGAQLEKGRCRSSAFRGPEGSP